MLANHDFAEMARHIGDLGVAACDAGQGDLVARIYWHSVEFGLAKEGGELKILGAGLASSFGEAHFSLESDVVERLPFSVERAVHTPYKHVPAADAVGNADDAVHAIVDILADDEAAEQPQND